MITLIGHGYIGTAIAQELAQQNIAHHWISHNDPISSDTTVIINAGGVTGSPNVDQCETDRQHCVTGNVLFPLQLEQKFSGPIVHVSSGCVYTGYKPGGWLETDPINFNFDNASFYSACKGLAQELLAPYLHKSYLLRVRMPFGSVPTPKNLLTKISNYPQLVDFENSISNVEDIARAAVFFATKQPEPGIYNVCNPGSVTTKQLADMLGLEKSWLTPEQFLQGVRAPRSNCVLNTDKLQAIFPLESAVDSVARCVAQPKNNKN